MSKGSRIRGCDAGMRMDGPLLRLDSRRARTPEPRPHSIEFARSILLLGHEQAKTVRLDTKKLSAAGEIRGLLTIRYCAGAA